MAENAPHARPATRPEHSEVYWRTAKYLILGLVALLVIVLVLAVVILLRVAPWS